MKPVKALFLSTAAMTISFVVWSVFSPIAGQIQDTFGLTVVQKSVLLAAPVLLGSVLRIPMGILTDRYGGKKVFAFTMLFLLLPLTGAGFAQSFEALLACALLIGMAGTAFAISIAFVSRWYPPERQGFILGIAGLGNLGSALANFAVPSMSEAFGLPWVFFGLAVAIGAMALVFIIYAKDPPAPDEPKTLRQSLAVTKYSATWLLSVYYFLTFGGFVSFSVYLPTLLKDLFHQSAFDAGMMTAGFVLLATLIRPAGGYLADRFGSQKVLTLVIVGILAGAFLLSFSLDRWVPFAICCLLLSMLLGMGNGAVFKRVPEVSSGHTGAVTGFVGAAGGLGGFFPPIVLGFVKEATGHYAAAFMLMAVFAAACLLLHFSGMKADRAGIRKRMQHTA